MDIPSTGNLKEDLVNAIEKNASGKSNMNEYAEDMGLEHTSSSYLDAYKV